MKKIVVVLGMGRSGTSLACQALSRMGVSFGDRLLGPSKRNERGHWEHLGIKKAQIAMTVRHGIAGYLFQCRMPDFIEPDCEQELAGLVAAEMERFPLFGFKEPLTTRLLPAWRRIFDSIQAQPVFIGCFRSPDAIYLSLLHEGEAFSRHSAETNRAISLIWAEYAHEIRALGAAEIWYEDWADQEERQVQILARAAGWTGALPRVYEPELCHA